MAGALGMSHGGNTFPIARPGVAPRKQFRREKGNYRSRVSGPAALKGKRHSSLKSRSNRRKAGS